MSADAPDPARAAAIKSYIDGLAAHLRAAARDELLGVATLERMSLHLEHPGLALAAVAEVRDRAQALGDAFRLIRALAAQPEIIAALDAGLFAEPVTGAAP